MNDPRQQPDFIPALFPRCDGQALPERPDGTDPAWMVKLEFLAAYYELNVCSSGLHAIRMADNGSGLAGEAQAAAHLEKAILVQEAITAKYALQGIAASTHWEGALTRNLTFSCPPRDRNTVRLRFSVPMPGDDRRLPEP